MVASETQLNADFRNIEYAIQRFADNMDFTYRQAVRWLSNRNTLGVVVDFLGMSSSAPPHNLAEFFETNGYHVPPLRAYTSVDDYLGLNHRTRRIKDETMLNEREVKKMMDAERKQVRAEATNRKATQEKLAKFDTQPRLTVAIKQTPSNATRKPNE
jgi:hypothetical protein